MKKVFVLFFILFAVSSYSQTYTNKGFSLSIGSGTSFSTTIKDYNPFVSIFASVGYAFNARTMARLEYSYIRFEKKSNAGDIAMPVFSFNIMYGRFEKCRCFQWYFNFGPGAYWLIGTDKKNNETLSDTEVNFGLSGGGGISIGISEYVRIFFEGQYHQIFNDGKLKNNIPLKLGVNYNLFK